MPLTKEQVADLRAKIEEGLLAWWDSGNTEALDALCAAALEPESLVGSKARTLYGPDLELIGEILIDVPPMWWIEGVSLGDVVRVCRVREDFTLLE